MALKAIFSPIGSIPSVIDRDGDTVIGIPIPTGAGLGDVNGLTLSRVDEVVTYADTTGKDIQGGSDVSIKNGVVERITPNEDLWIKVDTSQENIIIGRHDDMTGVPNVTNTTLAITSNATNAVVLSTTGDNSQSIEFVKQGIYRGQLNNDRDRNSIGLENANGKYLEILPNDTATFLVDKIGVGRTATTNDCVMVFADGLSFRIPQATHAEIIAFNLSHGGSMVFNSDTSIAQFHDGSDWYQFAGEPQGCAFNTFQNALPTLPIALDSYVTAKLGASNLGNVKSFQSSGSDSIEYTGTVRMKARVSCSFDYHIPTSIIGQKGYAFALARNFSPFTNSLRENNEVGNDGKYRSASLETVMFLNAGDTIQLRLKQYLGTLENDITIRNFTLTVISG